MSNQDKTQGYDEVLASLTPEMIERFRNALALGKWPDGRPLTPEQKETTLQAVMVWEANNLPEHERTGYIERNACASNKGEEDTVNISDLLGGQ